MTTGLSQVWNSKFESQKASGVQGLAVVSDEETTDDGSRGQASIQTLVCPCKMYWEIF